MELTAKQELFVQELIKGCSQRQAYKNSYTVKTMSENSIDQSACALFNNPKIQSRYKELLSKSASQSIITREELLEGLKLAFNMCLGIEVTPIGELTYNALQDTWRECETKLKKADLKALSGIADRISKLQGWDKVEEKKHEPIQIVLKSAKCEECENE